MTGPAGNEPLLSVVIPTYRRAADVDRAIRSVLVEPGDYFEVVVGDDASPDETPAVVERHAQDGRVRSYRNPANLGLRKNCRKAVQSALGQYVFLLTDDDYLMPGALAKVAAALRAHPGVGYVLSDLPTVDSRTGRVVDLHRTYAATGRIEPSLTNLPRLVRSAWVLSRQVLRREWIDWKTWDLFQDNIFFPMIVAGRLLLEHPCCYIADRLVMHTWFNRIYWSSFGRDEIDIEFNLARDAARCMAAILHDRPRSREVLALIEQWELDAFKSYLYRPRGFYDLARAIGLRPALRKLEEAYRPDRRQRRALFWFPFRIPAVRAWQNLKALARKLPPSVLKPLRAWKGL